jgi:hypothetical protein
METTENAVVNKAIEIEIAGEILETVYYTVEEMKADHAVDLKNFNAGKARRIAIAMGNLELTEEERNSEIISIAGELPLDFDKAFSQAPTFKLYNGKLYRITGAPANRSAGIKSVGSTRKPSDIFAVGDNVQLTINGVQSAVYTINSKFNLVDTQTGEEFLASHVTLHTWLPTSQYASEQEYREAGGKGMAGLSHSGWKKV